MIIKLMSICVSACFLFIFIMLAAIPVSAFLDTDILFWIGLIGELTWWLDGPPSDIIGGPYWDKICNLRVLNTCDY